MYEGTIWWEYSAAMEQFRTRGIRVIIFKREFEKNQFQGWNGKRSAYIDSLLLTARGIGEFSNI